MAILKLLARRNWRLFCFLDHWMLYVMLWFYSEVKIFTNILTNLWNICRELFYLLYRENVLLIANELSIRIYELSDPKLNLNIKGGGDFSKEKQSSAISKFLCYAWIRECLAYLDNLHVDFLVESYYIERAVWKR